MACDTVTIERVGDLFWDVQDPVPQPYPFHFTIRNDGINDVTINQIEYIAGSQFVVNTLSSNPTPPFVLAAQSNPLDLGLVLTDITGPVGEFHGLAIKASGPCGSVRNEIILHIVCKPYINTNHYITHDYITHAYYTNLSLQNSKLERSVWIGYAVNKNILNSIVLHINLSFYIF